MRVLWVLHTPRDPTTGVFAAVTADAEALRARGHEVEILTPGDLLTGWRVSPRWIPLVWPWAALRWLLRSPPFEVLIFHSFSGWGPALVRRWIPRLAKAVFATQFHGLEPLYRRAGLALPQPAMGRRGMLHSLYRGPVMNFFLGAACRRSDLVLCLNGGEKAYLVERRWAAAERVRIVHPPVPESLFGQRDYERRVERLIFVGQWQPGKGTGELLEAFRELLQSGLVLSLVCAGTRLAKEHVLADVPADCRAAVEVIPRFGREALPGILASCDVMVHPSHSEGSSLAVREAMAAGLPIVATSVGACPDFLKDRESARLVQPGDSKAIAEAVSELARDEVLRRRCGEGARAVAEKLQGEDRLALMLEEGLARRRQGGAC